MTPEITISHYKDKSEVKNLIENSTIFPEGVKPEVIHVNYSDRFVGIIMDEKYDKQIPISINKKN